MDLEISLDTREVQGKANRRLRRGGLVPGVVFGKLDGSTPVQVDAKTFETLYRVAGRTSVVSLKVPGVATAKNGIIKSVQRHPLTGAALHVDFLVVDLTHEMEVDVPLRFVGEAPAVEETGGTLLTGLNSVHVKALPNDIPHEIDVNVVVLTSLDVSIHVRDLSLNRDKVQVLTDPDAMVATVVPPRVEEEPELPAEAEAVEGEEGAEPTEGAEGAEEGAGEDGGDASSRERDESARS